MAASLSADREGAKVLLIEREERLGGVLKQCIHDGFGVIRFGEKLSGCEYSNRFIADLKNSNVDLMLRTFLSKVIKVDESYKLILSNKKGMIEVISDKIVFATGCRERTPRQVAIHGSRPSGVYTAGTAQYYINIMGMLPGKRCVILGSGDIGLIMARRLTLEGADVLGVYEAKNEPSGLTRNIFQCLEDFDIPLYLSHTVTKLHGRSRLEGVTVCRVDDNMKPIEGTDEYIECDTLIVSVGLIPENEIPKTLDVPISKHTKGPTVNQYYETKVKGIYACGNEVHVNDLVDYVSVSGEAAGKFAASKKNNGGQEIEISFADDYAYVVPQRVKLDGTEYVEFFFRSKKIREKVTVIVSDGDKVLFKKKYQFIKPPEMEKITVPIKDIKSISFRMEVD